MRLNKTLLSSVAAFAVASSFSACGSTATTTSPTSTTTTKSCSDSNVLKVSSHITESTTWGNATIDTICLQAGVKIRSGVTLTIEPGVKVVGSGGSFLTALKGAKIMANATAAKPIIFTSEYDWQGLTTKTGQWGGLTLIGNATTGRAATMWEPYGTDSDYTFGGLDNDTSLNDADSSGVLNYVEIKYSGNPVETDKEINGLSLCGVGNGTTISNITVLDSSDDGVEIWGGKVNLSNVTITGAEDDSFDADYNWTGTVDGLTIVQTNAGYAGMELSTSAGYVPTYKNFTITTNTASAATSEGAIYLKGTDTAGKFINGKIIHKSAKGILWNKAGKATTSTALTNTSFSNCTYTNSVTGGSFDGSSNSTVQDLDFTIDTAASSDLKTEFLTQN